MSEDSLTTCFLQVKINLAEGAGIAVGEGKP